MDLFETRNEAHQFGSVVAGAEKIDHVAFVSRPFSPLNDKNFPGVVRKPPAERKSRNPCTADDYTHIVRRI